MVGAAATITMHLHNAPRCRCSPAVFLITLNVEQDAPIGDIKNVDRDVPGFGLWTSCRPHRRSA